MKTYKLKNMSDNVIKYTTFSVTPYNKVGDKAYCEIRGNSQFHGQDEGPHAKCGCKFLWYNEHKEAQMMNADYLVNILNRMGKGMFVKYYYEFKDVYQSDIPSCDMIDKIEENYTPTSKATRIASGKRIFREGLELKALEIIINSKRLDKDIRQKARNILEEEKSPT